MATPSVLPRIAMFHGGGSSPQIFQRQCESLQRQLATSFELVYFGAPFESDPGAGVLPFFTSDKWGPYLNWYTKLDTGEVLDGTAGNYEDEEGIERVVRMMRETKPGGKWVGCLGFSQGTRVVAGLLSWQQVRRENGVVVDGGIDLQFGVLCMGAGVPMKSSVPESLLKWNEADPRQLVSRNNELIKIPTLHLHGLKDFCYQNGKIQMGSHFDPKTVTCIEIDYHHAMPWHMNDLLLLVENIKKMEFRLE
ncbi:hypothetical protein K3495_g9896 [Podosphaera aphanis]|nr:hypothetical protein K3495_g9896 [Podosphaera aphanis]